MRPRTLVISRGLAGRTVVELLRGQFHLTPADVKSLMRHNGIRLGGEVCRDLTRRVRTGQKLHVDLHSGQAPSGSEVERPRKRATKRETKKSAIVKGIRIVHLDPHIVVVDKPAGLTTVRHASELAEFGGRAQRFLPPTLVDLLPPLIAAQVSGKPGRVRAVHRLDRETSGLVVLARTPEAERTLGLQFRAHEVQRTYQALVRGRAKTATISSDLVRDRGDRRRGSGRGDKPQKAVTHVRVLKELGPFTLVECRLETGRTHQVRIHLGETGTPLCGERVYDRPVHGQPYPDESGASRPLLHAATLEFLHPDSHEPMSFSSSLPADMAKLTSGT